MAWARVLLHSFCGESTLWLLCLPLTCADDVFRRRSGLILPLDPSAGNISQHKWLPCRWAVANTLCPRLLHYLNSHKRGWKTASRQTFSPKPETGGHLIGSLYLFSALILSVLPYFSYSLPSNWLLQSHSNCIGDRPLKGCHGDQQRLMPHASLAFLTFAKALSLDISLALSSSFMRRCSSSTFPLHSIRPLIISHYFMRLDETHTHTHTHNHASTLSQSLNTRGFVSKRCSSRMWNGVQPEWERFIAAGQWQIRSQRRLSGNRFNQESGLKQSVTLFFF